MLTRVFICITVIGLGLFSSCDENVAPSEILVFLKPEDIMIEGNSGEHVLIQFDAKSSEYLLSNLSIYQTDDRNGLTSLLDSSLQTNSIRYNLDYVIPDYPDSTVVLLTFSVLNQNFGEARIAKKILVNRGATLLDETSGHVIYSQQSESPSAFELSSLSPLYLADTLTRQLDFMDMTSEEDGNVISKDWTSRSEISFVKFPNFNYAAANAISIQNTYDNGVKSSKITNIGDSDIYLFGRGLKAFGAVQFIAVIDQEGALNDKYVFNLKLISGVDFSYTNPNTAIE